MANTRRRQTPTSPQKRGRPAVSGQSARSAAPIRTERAAASWKDVAHLALLLGALVLSYVLPFELLVLSYAVLGPAHYLTEISWLHDRKYYLPHRGIALLLALAALGAMFLADAFWLGILVSFAFVACAILAATQKASQAAIFLGLTAVSFALLYAVHAPFGFAWVLVPSVIHVSVFTLAFMVVGAFKSRSAGQFVLVAVYLAALAVIAGFPPSEGTVIPSLARLGPEYFGDIAPALGSLFGVPDQPFDARITGLLSFVYTYHYLNWFIKADVIRWAAVPKGRLAGIVALSLGSIGLYFYNYQYGFMVLLLLSLTHVLLEFPLNSISLRQLGGIAGERLPSPWRRVRTG